MCLSPLLSLSLHLDVRSTQYILRSYVLIHSNIDLRRPRCRRTQAQIDTIVARLIISRPLRQSKKSLWCLSPSGFVTAELSRSWQIPNNGFMRSSTEMKFPSISLFQFRYFSGIVRYMYIGYGKIGKFTRSIKKSRRYWI